MLWKPDAQLIGHLPHHSQIAAVTAGFPLAQHL
jgi:hypothetical protein